MHIAAFSTAIGIRSTDPIQSDRPIVSDRFARIVAVLSAWMIFGLYLDGWAHSHFRIETFFTPWHAILYSGFLALAGFLFMTLVANLTGGYVWRRAMPLGYGLSVLGAVIFLVAGLADIVWHALFGFENDVEALVSPTHLSLALGGTLMVTGPLRAAWYQRPNSACHLRWPALSSLGLLLLILTFFTQIAHPFAMSWLYRADPAVYSSPHEHSPPGLNDREMAKNGRESSEKTTGHNQDAAKQIDRAQSGSAQEHDAEHVKFLREAVGLAGILLQSFILVGPVLFVVAYCQLPAFALTGLLTMYTALMVTQANQIEPMLIFAGLLTGLLGDLFRMRMGPFDVPRAALRAFAFLFPSVLYGLFFFCLSLTQGVGWSVHLWMGSLSMAGVIGLLTSYLLIPPARTQPEE